MAIGGGTQAVYDEAIVTAASNQAAAYNQAYSDFAKMVAPAMTLQGDDDANAAVDTYDDQESGLRHSATSPTLTLQAMQTADATGQASVIVSFDQSSPGPWADLSSAQAALSVQLTSQANALLTQTDAVADALETKDNPTPRPTRRRRSTRTTA